MNNHSGIQTKLTMSGGVTEENNQALIDSDIYEEALLFNKRYEKALMLIFKDDIWSGEDQDILSQDNSKVKAFKSWVESSLENKRWYFINKKNIKFVECDGEICVEILGDVFENEDEKGIVNGDDIFQGNNGKSLFRPSSSFKSYKLIPDWEKYKNFLPGNIKNKLDFLNNVLGLSGGGFHCNGKLWNTSGKYGHYWSHKYPLCMDFGENHLDIYRVKSVDFAFSLRYLKNTKTK